MIKIIETYINPILGAIFPLIKSVLNFATGIVPAYQYEIILVISVILSYFLKKSQSFLKIVNDGGLIFWIVSTTFLFLIFLLLAGLII